jgi:glycosyltransferase involved in cell wall biosynthesis
MSRPTVLHVINCNDAASIPAELAHQIDHSGFDVSVLGFYRPNGNLSGSGPVSEIGARNAFDLRAFGRLHRFIRDLRPDIVHVHHTLSASLGSVLGKLSGARAVVKSEHSDHRYFGLGQNMLNAVTLATADAVVCNSQHTARSFGWWESTLARRKTGVIYNGVNLEQIDKRATDPATARSQLGAPEDGFLVGIVGRLVPIKDHRTFLRAAALVVEKIPSTRFVIVGSGPLQRELGIEAAALGLGERVLFTGHVDRGRVYEILWALDLFVISSLSEGFCNAAVEAMAAGRPVVVTRVGALPEVVGQAGRFVPARSPEALAVAILDMASKSKETLGSMGQACRKRVEERFTIEQSAQEYAGLYRRLLSKEDAFPSREREPRAHSDTALS